ncbi:MAG: type I glyceraldehyde-3-phosphate dehydrogenase [Bdellovibrionales bacterium]|nr:type I glyceraldehyde-3-phosphate dehydrogenase [Bdellovibrionales bacterium]
MSVKVAINGFGRIGRVVFRYGFDKVDIVAINCLMSAKQMAHLLKYDSAHGKWNHDVSYDDSSLIVDGRRIVVSNERDPVKTEWARKEVDIVFECTGAFKNKEDFQKHIESGAKRVIVSAPAPGADLTMVWGINHTTYDPAQHKIVSNASCTTNCLAPLAKVLNETFGIENGVMTTVHSYTNDQNVLDGPHKDFRRARAAAVSMIPTTTGAAKAVGQVLPELNGKIDGIAIRVPTPNVSVVDFVINTKKPVTVAAINEALIQAAQGELKGVLRCEEDECVSCDFMGDTSSSIVDLPTTMIVGDKMAKVMSWYDNEVGFSNRMIDFAKYMNEKGL